MRIIGGEFKGRRLFSTKTKKEFRPTSEKVKESIFNILKEEVENREVLDLFAGSGNLGLEALSRGAKKVTFVDLSSKNIKIIRDNLKRLGLDARSEKDRVRVFHQDVIKCLHQLDKSINSPISSQRGSEEKEEFHIIFADPPYLSNWAEKLVNLESMFNLLAPEGILVIEHHKKESLASSGYFSLIKQRRFGDTMISFFKKG